MPFILSSSRGEELNDKHNSRDGAFSVNQESIKNYDQHDPISINSDEDFHNQASEENWPGEGTEDNPYIIEGYEIDGEENEHCLNISNTEIYFELRDNYFHSANEMGISLYNIKNGIVTQNLVSDNDHYATDTRGIHLQSSSENTLLNNTVKDNDHGIYLEESNDNVLLNNTASNNAQRGIYLDSSQENIVSSNALLDNDYYGTSSGLYLDQSNYNNLKNNIASGSDHGIELENSLENELKTNSATNNQQGIYVFESDNNYIEGNNVSDNSFYGTSNGVYLENSDENSVTENTALNNDCGIGIISSRGNIVKDNIAVEGEKGIWVQNSNNGTLENNIASNHSHYSISYGIYLQQTDNMTIKDNTAQNNHQGIELEASIDNQLSNNVLSKNQESGIHLEVSFRNDISNNEVEENEDGIYLVDSDRNTLNKNVVSQNEGRGIYLSETDQNEIIGNTVSENNFNIVLSSSTESLLANNNLIDNGISLEGTSIEYWNTHTIESSNTVNGKPAYYWNDETAGTVPEDAGQVIMANCTEVTVENQDISDVNSAIVVGYSDNVTLEDNTVSNNSYGFSFYESRSNLVTNNIFLNNTRGIYKTSSEDSLIYDNYFIDNGPQQAYDDGENDWDAGDPAEGGDGGNYWYDYEGEDRGDGFGEDPYPISPIYGGTNQDNYPILDPTSFVISVDDITAGEAPTITVSEARDLQEEKLDGEYKVEIRLDPYEEKKTKNLTFSQGFAEYTREEITKSGEYTVEVKIYDLIEYSEEDNFMVQPSDVSSVTISPSGGGEVRAGESVHFSASARDEYGNLITSNDEKFKWNNASESGKFYEETADAYIVTATYEGINSQQVTVNVTSSAPDTFSVEVDDIRSEEGPLIVIEDAYDEYNNKLNGRYYVKIIIDGRTQMGQLTFEDGRAEYEWAEIPTTDEYTVYVTMGNETETDSFQVYSSLMFFLLNFWWLILLISIIGGVGAIFVKKYGKQEPKNEYIEQPPHQEEQQYTMEEPDEEKEIDVDPVSEDEF